MRKRDIICIVLILICIGVLFCYQMLGRIGDDSSPPEIEIEEDQILAVSVEDDRDMLLQGVTATDKKDGDVTDLMVVESIRLLDAVSGTASVRIAAFDKAGNVAKVDREIQYTDYVRPRFFLSAPLIIRQNHKLDILDMISVSDTLDGDISHYARVTSLDGSFISELGNHDVELRVSNSLGDTVKLVVPVEVYPDGLYQAQLMLSDYLIYLDLGQVFDADDYLDTFVLNGNTTSLRGGMPRGYRLETSGTVDTSMPGVYSVAYKVTHTRQDTAGYDQTYTGYSKLIIVVEG